MPIVEIENLVKRYKEVTALDHLSLNIDEGEIFGLLGPNGSGKTTVINCILSLLQYDKGNIKVFGKEMTPSSYDIKKDIGVVMQNVAVYNELTVYENIDYFCSLYVKDKNNRKQLVEEAIDFVELGEFRKFVPKKLSGGLLRRLNIACGIAHKPKLIILDEPTVAVDPQSRNNILEGIKRLNKDGATVIYTSHYMEEVEQICSKIAILDNGKVIASGTKEDLKSIISLGEKVIVEAYDLKQEQLQQIKLLPYILNIEYEHNTLTVCTKSGKSNLSNVIDIINQNNIAYGKIYSELPTLNDVFLEITGKQLRD
ncbi:ABC transporter ATP-binding protein [Sedimentibacter sp. zth1]|uniref:ABC transporter ATP-binding protein n=1 Tax=Sedimentibacter sp. zth1 TaxID=2816908 RepID=UPI001A910BF2|nr:ABC transporter ATP-binding protein [Sedimentibacter sp. zth1]QSX05210.1 ABC transporter ATP-binding protein [Sedimentibacter sp. zth1]